MKRLDDVNDGVRLACLEALSAVTVCMHPCTSFNGPQLEQHMRGVYTSLLLHMDDSSQVIREAALETLRITGTTCPDLLMNLTTKAQIKHVHKDHCHDLIQYLQTLAI